MMLFLASNSPRRRQLLSILTREFQVISSAIDERVLDGEDAGVYGFRMATMKAKEAARQCKDELPESAVVLAADTVVVDGEVILGKPVDHQHAIDILERLRDHPHKVLTALAIFRPADGFFLEDICSTDVMMRAYTDAEILAYVESGDPMDKAGAYAIQHAGFNPVAEVRGCHANVMGLPVCRVAKLFEKMQIRYS